MALWKTISIGDTQVSPPGWNLVWGERPAVYKWQEGMGSKDKAEIQSRVLQLMARESSNINFWLLSIAPSLFGCAWPLGNIMDGPYGLMPFVCPVCQLPSSLPSHTWQCVCSSHTATGLLVGSKLIFPQRPFCLLGTAQIMSLGFCTLLSHFAKMHCSCQLVDFP